MLNKNSERVHFFTEEEEEEEKRTEKRDYRGIDNLSLKINNSILPYICKRHLVSRMSQYEASLLRRRSIRCEKSPIACTIVKVRSEEEPNERVVFSKIF